ncbi:cell division protein FtsQ [Edwardsiella ictaluri 93-146]|uniref:Cell division protein FtsQ n=2 Tax=Edwardsiella ictaluri TaxID=67780 RepID=C5B9F9_EDWI9|nr:cell division protein FtsQ [Edwardsiella ictaluri 93-146]
MRLAGMLFLLLVLAGIGWGGWLVVNWMKDASRMPMSKLVVTGARHFTRNDDIRQAILALGPPGTFMTQNVDVIQQQIERLPWIKQASVRKQWPNELKIHVVEYVPVARWNDLRLVDNNGKSFSVPADRTGKRSLPLLYGPEGSEMDVLEGYRAMSKTLAKDNFTLKMVAMSARHSWQLGLGNDIRLELGREDVAGRLARFDELYPALQQQAQATHQRVSYVDLRYDSGAAVGWAPAYIDTPPVGANQQQNQQQNQAQAKQQ